MNGVKLSDSLLKKFNENVVADQVQKKADMKDDTHSSGEEDDEAEGMWKVVKVMVKSRKMITRFSIILFTW